MATIDQPKQNFLSPIGFRFIIKRLPNTTFFVQSANIPGITSSSAEMPTPFKNLNIQQDKLEYEDLQVTVRMDEYLDAYSEVREWMFGLGTPNSFDEAVPLHAALPGEKDRVYSDATLSVFDSRKNAGVMFNFRDIFPVGIGTMTMDTTQSDVNYVTCDFTFKHNGFTVTKLNG